MKTPCRWLVPATEFVEALERRAAAVKSGASELTACESRIPERGGAWSHLLILTICRVCSRCRSLRAMLAKRLALVLQPCELFAIVMRLLRSGKGPGYIYRVLSSQPGDLWRRLRGFHASEAAQAVAPKATAEVQAEADAGASKHPQHAATFVSRLLGAVARAMGLRRAESEVPVRRRAEDRAGRMVRCAPTNSSSPPSPLWR